MANSEFDVDATIKSVEAFSLGAALIATPVALLNFLFPSVDSQGAAILVSILWMIPSSILLYFAALALKAAFTIRHPETMRGFDVLSIWIFIGLASFVLTVTFAIMGMDPAATGET